MPIQPTPRCSVIAAPLLNAANASDQLWAFGQIADEKSDVVSLV